MGDLLKAEIGAIQGLSGKVSNFASAIRELSTEPGLAGCAIGANGSKIASACSAGDPKVTEAKESSASRIELFSEACSSAGKEYGQTESEIAAGFSKIGDEIE